MRAKKSKYYWRNLFLFAGGALCIGALISFVDLSYIGARSYTHPARLVLAADETPAKVGIAYEDVHLYTADGLTLSAWYTPPENGVVILTAHGYSWHRSVDMHTLFARHGYGVLSWDFRAHGESAGELCTLGYNEVLDMEAALDFALAQEGVEQVGAWGGSMGAVTLIRTAARRSEIAAVVVDSAFPAVEEVIGRAIPIKAMRPLIRVFAEREVGFTVEALRPVDDIGHISPRPVLIIQGLADTVVASDAAERLYAAAGEPRQVWTEAGVGHLSMSTALPEEYERRVIEFLDAAFAISESSRDRE